MSRAAPRLLLTCEHGGNRVPAAYRAAFARCGDLLATHRGFDPGALALARALARQLDAPLIASTVTRLLVEPNRSLRHRSLFSSVTCEFSDDEKACILARYYAPHRERVESALARMIRGGRGGNRVVHVGVHSFTPVLNSDERRADIGLLYDPARPLERAFCARWRAALSRRAPELRVRMNYPYLGRSDGLTTALRRCFPARRYLGIELEVNQKWARHNRFPRRWVNAIAESLAETLA